MIDLSDCKVLGTLSKTHGIHGQLVLRLNNLRFDNIIKMETVFLEIEGLPVPFFVDSYTERSDDSLLIKFEDVETADDANQLTGYKVLIRSGNLETDQPDMPDMNTFSGYQVIDIKHGFLGEMDRLLDVQSNPLLRILSGKKEILIPFQQEFILGADPEKKILQVEIPEGLLDI